VRPVEGLVAGDSGATGMGGDHTHGSAPVYGELTKSFPIHLYLDLSLSGLDGA